MHKFPNTFPKVSEESVLPDTLRYGRSCLVIVKLGVEMHLTSMCLWYHIFSLEDVVRQSSEMRIAHHLKQGCYFIMSRS